MGKALAEQVKARKELQKKLTEGFTGKKLSGEQKKSSPSSKKEISKEGMEPEMVEGYKMEEVKAKDETTDLTSSGVQWYASLFVLLIIGLFVYGVKRRAKPR